ncbi:MAG TPA: hypothetical protein VF891_05065 [Gaiellaceae bacterium]
MKHIQRRVDEEWGTLVRRCEQDAAIGSALDVKSHHAVALLAGS